MYKFARATTQQFEFVFPEAISNYDDLLISFGQKNERIIDKTATDLTLVSGTTYSLVLTQDDTKRFEEGVYEVQVRGLKDDVAWASDIYRGRVYAVINDAILEE